MWTQQDKTSLTPQKKEVLNTNTASMLNKSQSQKPRPERKLSKLQIKESKRRNYSFHLLTFTVKSTLNNHQFPHSWKHHSHTHTQRHTELSISHILPPHTHTHSFLSATYYQKGEEKISNRKKTVTKTTKSPLSKR